MADTLLARLLLGGIGFLLIIILSFFFPILGNNFLFTITSYLTVFLSIFLFDFLFRGLEIIHVMTIRFIVMKTISFLLTIFFVRQDHQIILIPLFDILSSVIAIILVAFELQKRSFRLIRPKLKSSIYSLKTSLIYFLSDVSATAFNAISTIIIGLVFSSTEVALFGVSIQIIGAIQALLGQLSSGIYPIMVRQKSRKFIQQFFQKTIPLVFLFTGLILSYKSLLSLSFLALSTHYLAGLHSESLISKIKSPSLPLSPQFLISSRLFFYILRVTSIYIPSPLLAWLLKSYFSVFGSTITKNIAKVLIHKDIAFSL